jgi:hypothetical protein
MHNPSHLNPFTTCNLPSIPEVDAQEKEYETYVKEFPLKGNGGDTADHTQKTI